MAHTSNPRTQEAEAGNLPHVNFNLSYKVNPCLKAATTRTNIAKMTHEQKPVTLKADHLSLNPEATPK